MNKSLLLTLAAALFFGACAAGANRPAENPAPVNQTAVSAPPKPPDSGGAAGEKAGSETAAKDRTASCAALKIPGRRVDPKQTFAVDFAPFEGSCFVTAHDPEFTDPPLGSEFFIYRDGRELFRLPGAFNGTTTGCWAEAVAFQDLNGDNLTDVVVAGMCSAKSAPYSENMVYVNTGRDLTTDRDANYKLNDFKKIKDISDFVKRNKEQFFN
jgi:hypothetical protein